MSRTFDALTIPNFRRWILGATVANVGTWMQRVAQDWVVLTVLSHNSGTAVGIVTALQFGPSLVLSAWAGVLADRVNRRKLLLASQAAQGSLALMLGVLVLTGTAQLWHVFVFAAVLGSVTAIDAPVRQAFVSELVPRERMANAVGLNSTSFNVARLVGPGLAGLLIAWVGPGWVFVINGFSFLATILALKAVRVDELEPTSHVIRARGQVREGIAYVRGRADILLIMGVICIVSTFGFNFQLTSAMMARVEFGAGAGVYGLLGSALAIGSLGGALAAARRQQPQIRHVVGAALGFAVAMTAMAFAPSLLIFAIISIPVGFCMLTMVTAANTMIQLRTSPEVRGRVTSLYLMVFLGGTPIGSPAVGWIGEHFGPRWAVGVGAASGFIAGGAAVIWAFRVWHLRWQVMGHPHLLVEPIPLARAIGAASQTEMSGMSGFDHGHRPATERWRPHAPVGSEPITGQAPEGQAHRPAVSGSSRPGGGSSRGMARGVGAADEELAHHSS